LEVVRLKDKYVEDYVFIDNDTVLISTGFSVFEFTRLNIPTGKSENIVIDKGELEMSKISSMYYDPVKNRIMVGFYGQGAYPHTENLYFIYLDNHRIEEVLTITDSRYRVYYSSPENKVYLGLPGKDVEIYDVDKRQFLESMVLPRNVSRYFEAIYGAPAQFLTTYKDGYYLWDSLSNTSTVFPKIDMETRQLKLIDFTHLKGSRFLCVNSYRAYEDEVVEVDLATGEISSLISPNSWGIRRLKKYSNQRCGFILEYNARHVFYNPERTLLCFFDCP
jgi:hypothetical protein